MDLVVRGINRQIRGDAAGAVADFDEALRADPRRAEARSCRGVARRSAGDLAGAIADFDAALEIDPSHAQTYCNRAAARHASGDHKGALADLDAALALHPGLAVAYNSRGAVRLALWDVPGALADFDAAIRINPNLCLAYLGRGHARYHLGDPEARQDYVRAFAIDARLAAARCADVMFEACRNLKPRQALADSTRHIEQNPADWPAYVKRAGLLLVLGREDESRRVGEEVAIRNPRAKPILEAILAETRRRLASA